jgi:uncharacterized repeat protein (TIGR01451 family)
MNITKQCYLWAMCLLPFAALAQGDYWQRTYNDGFVNFPMATAARDGSGYVAVGYVNPSPSPSYGLMLKTNKQGIVTWRQTDTLRYTHITATQDSGFLVVGFSIGQWTHYLRKLDKRHNVQWSKPLGTMSGNIGSIIQTADLDYAVYGSKPDSLWIHKIDRSGNTRWVKTWRNPFLSAGGMVELSDGGFLLSHGSWTGSNNMDSASALLKTDALGNVQWKKPMRDGGVGSVSVQNGRITYPTTLLNLHQVDVASGNTIRTLPNQWSTAVITQRRLGGSWMVAFQWDAANNRNIPYLIHLDADANVVSRRIIPYLKGYAFDLVEKSDSVLFLQGQGLANQDWFMATMDTLGQINTNLIGGTLSSSCGNHFQNWLVGATRVSDGLTFYSKVDALNRYDILVDTGTFSVQAYPPSLLWESNIPMVTQTRFGQHDTIPLRINCLVNCPDLRVDISTPILRRCFNAEYSVNYCNDGTITANNTYIEVKLDSLLQYLNASIPLTSRVGQLLRFNVGTLGATECGQFTIGVRAACGDSTRLGQSLCTDVRIYPDTICGNLPTWTGANLRVQGICERDSVHFTVSNVGRVASSAVRRMSIENATIVSNTLLNVGANAQLHYRFPANGSTWRMSVEQEPNHPYRNQPVAVIEGCRNNPNTPISTGFVQQLPLDTRMPTARTYCMTLVGAYDPNDKMSFPAGYGANRLVEPNQDLEYMIRFQNTGTDTAFTVVIKDTLSNLLDASSIQPLSASHRYEWTILKNNVLQFTFPNLLLVDSFHNEPKSHGFIKFHIKQKPNVALGSKLYNSAAIYFDYNAPVITNRTMLTIGKQFIVSGIVNPTSKLPMRIRNYPNPTADRALLEILDGNEDNATRNFQLLDVTGRVLRQANFNGNRYEFERDGLNAGFYLFRVTQQGQMLGTGSIVIQ